MYTICCPSCADVIHYGIRHPMFAIVSVAIVLFAGVGAGGSINYYICEDIELGTDAMAEQYYEAILQVHRTVGFTPEEYPQTGLTLAQVREIACNDTDEEAKRMLEEDDWGTGRLYFYYLVATYHRWLHPEDARYTLAQLRDDPEIVETFEIDPEAYDYATVAYFHDRAVTNNYLVEISQDRRLVGYVPPKLPTKELNMVKDLIPTI